MARFLVPILAALTVTACGQTPADAPSAAEMPAPPAAATAPDDRSAPALTIEASCRRAVEILYGQSGAAVTFDPSDFSLSWPAPVDGGRLNFACSVVGVQVTLSNARQTRTVDLSAPATAPDSGNSVRGT